MQSLDRLQDDIFALGRKVFWRHYLVDQDKTPDEPTGEALRTFLADTHYDQILQAEIREWFIAAWQGASDDSVSLYIQDSPYLAEYQQAIKDS